MHEDTKVYEEEFQKLLLALSNVNLAVSGPHASPPFLLGNPTQYSIIYFLSAKPACFPVIPLPTSFTWLENVYNLTLNLGLADCPSQS